MAKISKYQRIMINKYFKFQVLVFTILFSVSATGLKAADHPVNIIPAPLSMKILKGEFAITSKTNITVFPSNPEVLAVAAFFANRIDSVAGLDGTTDEEKTGCLPIICPKG